MQKEIPILFSTPMVQAILAGRKTMTRRIMKPQPWYGSQVPNGPHFIFPPGSGQRFNAITSTNGNWYTIEPAFQERFSKLSKYGQPGDILWARESFMPFVRGTEEGGYVDLIKFKSDDTEIVAAHNEKWTDFKPMPSIHMPKAAARIWLEVENIRVERVQDITEEDAIAEGVDLSIKWSLDNFPDYSVEYNKWVDKNEGHACRPPLGPSPKQRFEKLWQKINGAESWEANPWVWVVSFKVLSTTGRPDLSLTT